MSNISTLQPAPPFTKENAAEMGRRSAAKRKAKIAALAKLNERPEIAPEINRVVKAMSKLKVTSDDYARLAGILERLWDKAFPKMGTSKPGRRSPGTAQPEPLPADPGPQ